jgi:hypothetical protein
MQSTGFLDALAAICGFWAVWVVLEKWAELPEKWGFEAVELREFYHYAPLPALRLSCRPKTVGLR